MKEVVTNEQLVETADEILDSGEKLTSQSLSVALKTKGIEVDQSTIRTRFIEMGKPIGSYGKAQPIEVKTVTKIEKTEEVKVPVKSEEVDFNILSFVPSEQKFANYVERDIDKSLAMHYALGKYPLTQGKQGTGKTSAHEYYAMKQKLPFFLFSLYEDFRLTKLYGDKTIENGSIKFVEALFVKAIQNPSVILFDEINAVSNANTFDFHALLQNRELFIKDAEDGKGKVYKLHPKCRIGFAQNPRSNKYIGGNIKPSNFLGRCTFLTFPEFSKGEIMKLVNKKYKNIPSDVKERVVTAYFDLLKMIDSASIAIDISIRQLTNILDFIDNGADVRDAFEQTVVMFLDGASLPALKPSFISCIGQHFPEMLNKREQVVLEKATNKAYYTPFMIMEMYNKQDWRTK